MIKIIHQDEKSFIKIIHQDDKNYKFNAFDFNESKFASDELIFEGICNGVEIEEEEEDEEDEEEDEEEDD